MCLICTNNITKSYLYVLSIFYHYNRNNLSWKNRNFTFYFNNLFKYNEKDNSRISIILLRNFSCCRKILFF